MDRLRFKPEDWEGSWEGVTLGGHVGKFFYVRPILFVTFVNMWLLVQSMYACDC